MAKIIVFIKDSHKYRADAEFLTSFLTYYRIPEKNRKCHEAGRDSQRPGGAKRVFMFPLTTFRATPRLPDTTG